MNQQEFVEAVRDGLAEAGIEVRMIDGSTPMMVLAVEPDVQVICFGHPAQAGKRSNQFEVCLRDHGRNRALDWIDEVADQIARAVRTIIDAVAPTAPKE
jgi:hypothetical protein